MKIVCIADTHGKHDEVTVPDGDLLIHAGDCTIYGHSGDLKDFLKWFAALPHRNKILIAGNHDWIFERQPDRAMEIIKKIGDDRITYLCHESCLIENIAIFGSPYTPEFCDWAFNVRRDKLPMYWKDVSSSTQILVTHGPVAGGRDWAPFSREHVGDDALLQACIHHHIPLHICGHIHNGYGMVKIGDTLEINASVVNEAYEVVNEPIVICSECRERLTGDEGLDREVHGRCGL